MNLPHAAGFPSRPDPAPSSPWQGARGAVGVAQRAKPEVEGVQRLGMDHTPQTPAQDDRPLRVLERTPVPEAHRERLYALVRKAQAEAASTGDELQAEFGKEHVALIVGCNQFLRLWKGGTQPGCVELLLDPPHKDELASSGYFLDVPEGQIFRLFGWVRVDPMSGNAKALEEGVARAYRKAKASAKKR